MRVCKQIFGLSISQTKYYLGTKTSNILCLKTKHFPLCQAKYQYYSTKLVHSDVNFSLEKKEKVNEYIKSHIQNPSLPLLPIEALPSVQTKNRAKEIREYIKVSEDFETVAQYYFENQKQLTHFEFKTLVIKLSNLSKHGKISPIILQGEVMQAICYDVWKIIPSLNYNDVLKFFKEFLQMGIQTDSLLMQSFLKLMTHQINIQDLSSLLLMERLLHKTPNCKLKLALQEALPYAIENHMELYVKLDINYNEAWQLFQFCLYQGMEKQANLVLDDILINKFPSLVDGKSEFMRSILLRDFLIGIEALHMKEHIKPFLIERKISSHIQQCLEAFSIEDLSFLKQNYIFEMLKSVGCLIKYYGYLKENYQIFFETISQLAIDKNWNYKDCSTLVKSLKWMGVHLEDLTIACLGLSGKSTNNLDIYSMTWAIEGLASLKQVPLHLEDTKEFLVTEINNYEPKDPRRLHWLNTCLEMLAINVVPSKILKQTMTDSFLNSYFKKKMPVKHHQLALIHQTLTIMFPEQLICLPSIPEHYLQKSYVHYRKMIQPSCLISSALQDILGDNRSASNLETEALSPLDNVIILDENRSPILLPEMPEESSGNRTKFQLLNIDPSVSQERRIVFKVISDRNRLFPESRLSSSASLECKLLEKQGFKVIMFFYNDHHLTKFEQLIHQNIVKYFETNNINV